MFSLSHFIAGVSKTIPGELTWKPDATNKKQKTMSSYRFRNKDLCVEDHGPKSAKVTEGGSFN